jgi:phage-related protein
VARFSCKTPFGFAPDYTNAGLTVNVSPINENVQNMGTIDAEPVIYLVVDSATSVTAVLIRNLTNGDEIQYVPASPLSVGDVLKFDSEEKEVLHNGTAKSYSGAFLRLDVGGNLIQFIVTGTSFSMTATIKHRSRHL